jgi:hypothetical protein
LLLVLAVATAVLLCSVVPPAAAARRVLVPGPQVTNGGNGADAAGVTAATSRAAGILAGDTASNVVLKVIGGVTKFDLAGAGAGGKN